MNGNLQIHPKTGMQSIRPSNTLVDGEFGDHFTTLVGFLIQIYSGMKGSTWSYESGSGAKSMIAYFRRLCNYQYKNSKSL